MEFISLPGERSYVDARMIQLKLVEERLAGQISDTVLFLEHTPTITRGRGLQWSGAPRERSIPLGPLPPEIAYEESERGGDLTYHGPGQLVVYPIVKLEEKNPKGLRDVTAFLRWLENTVIEELKARGLQAQAKKQAAGVWIKDQKIASMGIAVKRWVTYHGIAINCTNSLEPFQLISPCGFSPEIMTRLCDWVPLSGNWRKELEKALAYRMDPNAVFREESSVRSSNRK